MTKHEKKPPLVKIKVASARAQPKPKPKPRLPPREKKMRISRTMPPAGATTGPVKSFVALCSKPFDRANWGAICPDGMNCGAVSYSVRSVTTLTAGGSWNPNGVHSIQCFPNPLLYMWQFRPTTGGDGIAFNGPNTDPAGFSIPNPAVGSGGVDACGLGTIAQLSTIASAWRPVSSGIRMRSIAQASVAAATVAATFVPVAGIVPPVEALQNNVMTDNNSLNQAVLGINSNVALWNYEGTARFTSFDVMVDVMEFVFKPTDTRAFQWRPCGFAPTGVSNTVFQGSINADYVIANTATGLVDTTNSSGMSETMDMRGWPGLNVAISGSSANQSMFEIEQVIHYEIIPAASSGSIGTPSSSEKVGSANAISAALSAIAKSPEIRQLAQTAINGAKKTASNALLRAAAGIVL